MLVSTLSVSSFPSFPQLLNHQNLEHTSQNTVSRIIDSGMGGYPVLRIAGSECHDGRFRVNLRADWRPVEAERREWIWMVMADMFHPGVGEGETRGVCNLRHVLRACT